MQQHIDVVIQHVLFRERSEQCVHIELLHDSISSIIGLWCNIVYLQKQEASFDPLGEMKIFFTHVCVLKMLLAGLKEKWSLHFKSSLKLGLALTATCHMLEQG